MKPGLSFIAVSDPIMKSLGKVIYLNLIPLHVLIFLYVQEIEITNVLIFGKRVLQQRH